MAIRLYLVPGDRVRNIRINSNRKGWCGTVHTFDQIRVLVKYDNGTEGTYLKTQAHVSLELVRKQPTRQQAKATTYAYRYGTPYTDMFKADFSELEAKVLAAIAEGKLDAGDYFIMPEPQPTRRVLKKVRRNVLTGKTQEQTIAEVGAARGVQQFNTRALGTTTGQVFHAIGCAMTNPGTPIRIANVDHAKDQPGCSTSWTSLNKHFRSVLIKHLGDMKGFTLDETHITFNPIVTEETYVEIN